jgi:hypothetical protein
MWSCRTPNAFTIAFHVGEKHGHAARGDQFGHALKGAGYPRRHLLAVGTPEPQLRVFLARAKANEDIVYQQSFAQRYWRDPVFLFPRNEIAGKRFLHLARAAAKGRWNA